jgi:amino acid adenylation domain-containing protein
MNIGEAPMMRLLIAQDAASGSWTMVWLLHQLAGDHVTAEVIVREIAAYLARRGETFPLPMRFRDFVAQARLIGSQETHTAYFSELLGDVAEPTAPFGLFDVHGDGTRIIETRHEVAAVLARRIRQRARALRTGASSIFHLAFGRMLGSLANRQDVVFGTVVLGRMQRGGASGVPGPFINTLPVRIKLGGKDVEQSVKEVHNQLLQLLRYEHASLSRVQRCSAVPAPQPLITALLNYRHNSADPRSSGPAPNWEGVRFLGSEERTNYPLLLSVNDLGDGFSLDVQVQEPLDSKRICAYMHTTLENVVQALERGVATAIGTLDVLPPEEHVQLLEEWNATRAEYPRDRSVHQLFEEQVERTPTAVAIVHAEQSLTYEELNRKANRLARHLLSLGAGPRRPVAILLPPSLALVCAQLAVLKCGSAYVPLDPGGPWQRQELIIRDCEAEIVLSHADAALPQVDGVQRVNAAWEHIDREASNLDVLVHSESAAYIMYTSGSEGRPNGVIVPHRAIGNLVLSDRQLHFTGSDRVAFASNPAFDASTLEVWAPLLNGGCIVAIDRTHVLDPERLGLELKKQAVNVLWLTAGLFSRYADALAPIFCDLRCLIVGGEALDPRVVARTLRTHQPRKLLNGYGPTETTTFATTYRVTEVGEQATGIPIGRPMSNTRIYILDECLRSVPVGIIGELYIGGEGVACGYCGRPDLTAARFVADPYYDRVGGRMYRTGDMGRYLPDGNIEYVGRKDFQVKVRGFRIEPAEIEARLREHPGVLEAVVVAREEQGDRRMVAYYRRDEQDAVVTSESLRAHLQRHLPEYMVPAAYVAVELWPLTSNGKLDRRGLPIPGVEADFVRAYEPPTGETEETLARIWSELLQVERVGRHDSFFAFGGHSLLAITAVERMRQAGLQADVRGLFAQPTLSALAAALTADRPTEARTFNLGGLATASGRVH